MSLPPTTESSTLSPPKPKAVWRRLTESDIPSLFQIASAVHPSLPERPEVFSERIALFPEGCLALVDPVSNTLCGYAISHPILRQQPPALDSLLDEIAQGADQYYIHDLAILPEARGGGLAKEGVERLLDVGREFRLTGLVSVYGTDGFWDRFGFVRTKGGGVQEKVREYGEDAVFMERGN